MPAKRKKTTLINLLPKEGLEDTTLGRVLKWALTSFRFIVIVVELIVIVGFLSRFWLDIQNNDLTEEITQKSAVVSSYSSFEEEFRKTQKKLAILSSITNEKNTVSPLVAKIVQALPQDAQLISLGKNENIITIQAATLSENSIASFMNNLSGKGIGNVGLVSIESKANSPLIQFIISITQGGGTDGG